MSLRIAFLNVGQGDTTILFDLDSRDAVIVDCLNAVATIDFLKLLGLARVRALIITHFHADHFLGAVAFLDGCEQQGIKWDACICRWDKELPRRLELLSDSDGHSGTAADGKRTLSCYRELLYWARKPGNKAKIIDHHDLVRESRVISCLRFLHPEHRDVPELFETARLNNLSYVVQVTAGGGVLLPGDLEAAGWKFLRDNHSDCLASAILKFPHHGGWKGGEIAEILDSVRPIVVVVSVGSYNKYGHPSQELFHELRSRPHIRVLCTQATPKCYVREARSEVLQVHEADEDPIWARITSNVRGSPCAGSILIELDGVPNVLQPPLATHVEKIIRPYMGTHQCVLPNRG